MATSLVVALAPAAVSPAGCASPEPSPHGVLVSHDVALQLQTSATADVLVTLIGSARSHERELEAALAGGRFSVTRRFRNIDAFAATIDSGALQRLRQLPRLIRAIELDHEGTAHLSETSALLEAPRVHETLGVTGEGVTIAILDSGIDGSHPDLAGRIVAEHCFTDGACEPGTSDGPSEGDLAFDDTGHGTHVAGIIASQGAVSSAGIAPGVKLIAVRVLADNRGRTSDWVAALDWLLDQFEVTPFQIVSMSLGTSALYADDCGREHSAMAAALDELIAKGVVVIASTGNAGSHESISAPACIGGTLAVAAGYDAEWERLPLAGTYSTALGEALADCFDSPANPGSIACFSNVSPQVELVAPGALITAPVPFAIDSLGVQTLVGTSQAAPAAAAVAALMLETSSALSPSDVAAILVGSGVHVNHRETGLSMARVDAGAALGRAQCFGLADGAGCDDGDACSVGDICLAGGCTAGVLATDGTPCSDGNACTNGDSCLEGVCRDGEPTVCSTTEACRQGGFCRVNDGACYALRAGDSTSCDDDNPCTDGDHCEAGFCVADKSCAVVGACQEGGCDPKTGECLLDAKDDGAQCPGGVCIAGDCTAGASEPDAPSDEEPDGCSCVAGGARVTPAFDVGGAALYLICLGWRRRRRFLAWIGAQSRLS